MLRRLILYYPVSALVTLFANILQNPQDARARGDLRLMSSVCSFLTMLEREISESNGNVRRMLSVCREFERIASVVLDKAEKEMRGGRRKAKVSDKAGKERKGSTGGDYERGLDEGKSVEQIQVETQAAYRRPVNTPSLRMSQAGSIASESPRSWAATSPTGGVGPEYRTPLTSNAGFEAGAQQQQQGQQQRNQNSWQGQQSGYGMSNGNGNAFSQQQQQQLPPDYTAYMGQPGMSSDHNANSNFFSPNTSAFSPNTLATMDMNSANAAFNTSPDLNNGTGSSFQQPFVPQDLWQMPMTLEWDWAEGLGLGSFTPGPMFDGYSLGEVGGGDFGGGQQQQ